MINGLFDPANYKDKQMKTRKLGLDGPQVSAIGLGCMSFAGFFGSTDKAESFDCLDSARDRGITFWTQPNYMGKAILKN